MPVTFGGTMEHAPMMTKDDRDEIRRLWLKVQDGHCGVCGTDVPEVGTYRWRWVLAYQRTHDGVTCAKDEECFDCVLGVICRYCMLLLPRFTSWRGNIPRKPVNGVMPREWALRASHFLDLGVPVVHTQCDERGEPG